MHDAQLLDGAGHGDVEQPKSPAVVTRDGRKIEGSFPDKKAEWPRLLYHRYFMLSEHLSGLRDPNADGDGPPGAPKNVPENAAERPDAVLAYLKRDRLRERPQRRLRGAARRGNR